MDLESNNRRGGKLLSLLLREESHCHVVVGGTHRFKAATNEALQLARSCTFGKRLCEYRIAVCDSWATGLRYLPHHRIEVVPESVWTSRQAEYAGYLTWLLSRQVLYELDGKTPFDEAIESTAQGVESATLDDLRVDEDSKKAALDRSMMFLRPKLIAAQKRRLQRRRAYRLFKRMRFALARRDLKLLHGKRVEDVVYSVRIVGAPVFVASTRRAMQTLAKTPSVFVARITTQIREIREVSHLPNTRTLFALRGSDKDVLVVLWSEVRRSYIPVQYAALLAWHAGNSSGTPADTSSADAAAMGELRFMHSVCEESGAPAAILDHIEFQLRRYYGQHST